jgi:methyl-accepting chemotaxis protein
VLSASGELTSTAEILAREVDKFFCNLRADPLDHRDETLRTG